MSEIVIPYRVKNLVGHPPFGRLTVIAFAGIKQRPSGKGHARWKCLCECGNECFPTTGNLMSGNSESCGCLRNELTGDRQRRHGQSSSDEFRIWQGIQARCYNPNTSHFTLYGGRGITMFDGWLGSDGFASFFPHVGPRPSAKHTIDRFPNMNGNYEPGNVRWATVKEQNRNRRSTVFMTFRGETHCLLEWSEITGISESVIGYRRRKKWSVERTLTTPHRIGKYHYRSKSN